MKPIFIITLCAAMAASGAEARHIMSINDGWRYAAEGDSTTTAVHLPHCWNSDAYSTRDYRRGTGTYTRKIAVPADMAGQRVVLRLDGAATSSEVSIDGRSAGTHAGGYTPHVADITAFVTPGATHELVVTVDNDDADVPPHSADFTFMGGLYRDAWLTLLDPLHLDITGGPAAGFRATGSLTADGAGAATVGGTLVNDSGLKRRATVVVSIAAPDGTTLATKKLKVTAEAGGTAAWTAEFPRIEGIEPWSPEHPALYDVRVSVEADGKTTDSGTDHIGFRSFAFDEQGRFLLNGSPCKLRGMNRHQDQRPMGIALTDEMHRRDIEMIKRMGANFLRISHYPQDDAVLEMCDRLGLIVWEEIPVIDYVPDNATFADNAETMLREMIRSHYNHPSVAMWGYMNEILLTVPGPQWQATTERTRQLARRLEDALKEEDPGRMSTMAFHGSDVYHSEGLSDITDVQGWNLYQGWYGGALPEFEKFLSRQHREHPSHRLIVSEYGAGSDRRVHSLEAVPFDFSIEYQQKYLEHYLPVIEDSAFVAGAAHWNFIDFSSANRAESMPRINNKGLADNDRRPKDVYHYYRAAWRDAATDTVVHIAVRDWAERTEIMDESGTAVRPIKIYTNLPQIRLRVNGTMLPAQRAQNFNAVFDAALRPGTNVLEAFGESDKPLDATTIELRGIATRDGRLDCGTDELAINVGTRSYFRSDDSGLTWLPDREYAAGGAYGHIGGERYTMQDEIALTRDTPLLQRGLAGLEEYRIDVEPGRYEIELSWAEQSAPTEQTAYLLGHNSWKEGTAGTRMDIAINGRSVERGFAPADVAGTKAMVKRRYIVDTAGEPYISVVFTGAGGGTALSALKLRRI